MLPQIEIDLLKLKADLHLKFQLIILVIKRRYEEYIYKKDLVNLAIMTFPKGKLASMAIGYRVVLRKMLYIVYVVIFLSLILKSNQLGIYLLHKGF